MQLETAMLGKGCRVREGILEEQILRAGGMACLRVLMAEWIFDFSSRGSERSPQVA